MNRKKNLILLSIMIIAITAILLIVRYESQKQLNGAEKNIYRIFKEDEKLASTNFESVNETTEISVMSYNIHRGKDQNDKYTLDEIMNLLKESDADIICLQEVLFSHHTQIRESGEYKSQFVANIDIPIVPTGVATYSKYPIIESHHIMLSSKTEPRGALHTAYKINNKIVNVINVHLGLNKKERQIQIKEILEFCENLEGEVIFTGDFNEKELTIDNFRDVGKYHGYDKKRTYIPKEARIDYIFITTEDMYSTTYNILNTDLSDHYPIMANIKYKPEHIDVNENSINLESIWLKLLKRNK